MESLVALVQGIYFFVFGVWPIVHMDSFLKVTGPKTDLWLVKTVGLLLSAIGVALVVAQVNGEINTVLTILGIGSALTLALIDVIYVARRVITPTILVMR